MKTTQKHQSFLANSSKKYFKFGLGTSILFCIAIFELPIYAGTPKYELPKATEPEGTMIISNIVPIKESVRKEEEKVVEKKSPVEKLIITLDPLPIAEPEAKKSEPITTASNLTPVLITDPSPKVKKEYTVVEIMPEFKRGLEEMYKYFGKNIQYNLKAMEFGIEGKVYVRFIVGPDGSISNVEIAKGVDPLLDNEAIRVVKNMPKWNPGIQNGEKVSVVMILPVNFVLQ